MNKEEIMKMDAGRELDALVAEKVMGWLKTDSGLFVAPPTAKVYAIEKFWNDEDKLYVLVDTIGGLLHETEKFELWQPSTDIAAAWLVVEKILNSKYIQFELSYIPPQYYVRFDHLRYFLASESAPLAICRAALLATLEE